MKRSRPYTFTSESVTEGHPDKMADQISDAILDEVLRKDRNGKVACETLLTSSLVFVAGEITTESYVDIPKVVRDTVKEIGYDDPEFGFDYKSCAVVTSIQEQSGDIRKGVTGEGLLHEQGAGDQGLMFGYATNETDEMIPATLLLAHKLTKRLAEVRKKGILDYIGPDGKSQVSVDYIDGMPAAVPAVVIATQHRKGIDHSTIKKDVIEYVIRKTIPEELLSDGTMFHVNETGEFTIGGPHADTGLTGRKIIVDTYGGVGSHGGGALSGKDPSKVDRSGSYMARYVAKNLVKAGLADRMEVQIAYAIGVARPVSLMVDACGTEKIPEEEIESLVRNNFDLRPRAIIDKLDLLRPIYRKTAAYGHFGREGFPWERTDMADLLREQAGI
ncbi:MAG: methionine adenosyltransferase [Thermoplasmata archaeon]|nr:MAG: methionine adenosyltransferase [Thermoplasmata archaeon]